MVGSKRIVVFTGAGISAESGLKTFRGDDGLWEGYSVEDVATPQAWEKDMEMVQHFYNIRRSACRKAEPNAAHSALVKLAAYHQVQIITQNIDDLHERAGSASVLHLHGEIMKSQSSKDCTLVYPIVGDVLRTGDLCELGTQLRPNVVWFGEAVPNMLTATEIVRLADILLVIGTSLQVYPAANLIHETKAGCQIILIDPKASHYAVPQNTVCVDGSATVEVPKIVELLTE